MLKSIVRDALLTSVTWTRPPVSCQTSQESIVPNASLPASAFVRAPGMLSRIQASLVPEKYASMTSPVRCRTRLSKPSAFSASQRSAVRRSCQTIALQTGSPVCRSQTTVVSRWFVMPIAATPAAPVCDRAMASAATAICDAQISFGSCSTHPGFGKICGNSRWATAATAPL